MDSRVHENEEGPRGRLRMGPRIREDTGWGAMRRDGLRDSSTPLRYAQSL